MRIPFCFEKIDSNHSRARVIGGWLVKATNEVKQAADWHNIGGAGQRIAMTFVPDPDHEWKI